MKWTVHLTGEGYYWWIATTPIGPYYVSWNDNAEWGKRCEVEWFPFDTNGDPEKIAQVATEDDGKAAAEAHVKVLARKLRKWVNK